MSAKDRRRDARAIFDAALAAVDPETVIAKCVSWDADAGALCIAGRVHRLDRDARLVVIGAGKASARMASAFERRVGDRIDEGLVVVKYGHGAKLERVRVVEAGHPVPDEAGLEGARRVRASVEALRERDLVDRKSVV